MSGQNAMNCHQKITQIVIEIFSIDVKGLSVKWSLYHIRLRFSRSEQDRSFISGCLPIAAFIEPLLDCVLGGLLSSVTSGRRIVTDNDDATLTLYPTNVDWVSLHFMIRLVLNRGTCAHCLNDISLPW